MNVIDDYSVTDNVVSSAACCLGEIGCSRMRYRVYFINTRQVCTFEVREDEMQTIKMTSSDGSIEVDLPTGRLTVDASIKPIADYLTLTFAIGVSFVTMRKPSYTLVMTAKYCRPMLFNSHLKIMTN